MVEQRTAVRLLDTFKFSKEPGQQITLYLVSCLRGLHTYPRVIVAHVMCQHLDADTCKEGGNGLPIGQNTGAVCLECGGDKIIHQANLILSLGTIFGLWQKGFWLRLAHPALLFAEANFDIADTGEILVQLIHIS